MCRRASLVLVRGTCTTNDARHVVAVAPRRDRSRAFHGTAKERQAERQREDEESRMTEGSENEEGQVRADRKIRGMTALGRIWSERWVKRERERKGRRRGMKGGEDLGRSTRHRVRTLGDYTRNPNAHTIVSVHRFLSPSLFSLSLFLSLAPGTARSSHRFRVDRGRVTRTLHFFVIEGQ